MKGKCNHKRKWVFVPIAIGCLFLAGLLIMLLWNNILPEVFGLPTLTYWQAFGLFILCKLLFGFGGGGPRGGPCRGGRRHFKGLDADQKEKIRRYMEKQCNKSDETNPDL